MHLWVAYSRGGDWFKSDAAEYNAQRASVLMQVGVGCLEGQLSALSLNRCAGVSGVGAPWVSHRSSWAISSAAGESIFPLRISALMRSENVRSTLLPPEVLTGLGPVAVVRGARC